MSQAEVTRRVKVSRTAASRWEREYRKAGRSGLRRRPAPGRPPRLSKEQIAELPALYDSRRFWTCEQFSAVIAERFGIKPFHPDHVSKIMQALSLPRKNRPAAALPKVNR